MRFAIQQRNKAKSERGRAQQKQPQPRFAMDTVVKRHCVATHKKMHKRIGCYPEKWNTLLNCCCWQTPKESIGCTQLQSSLSESCHKFLLRCSVQDEQCLPCTERWVQEQEEQIVGSQIVLYRPPLQGSGWDNHIRHVRWPVKIRHSPSSSLGGHEYRTRSKGTESFFSVQRLHGFRQIRYTKRWICKRKTLTHKVRSRKPLSNLSCSK